MTYSVWKTKWSGNFSFQMRFLNSGRSAWEEAKKRATWNHTQRNPLSTRRTSRGFRAKEENSCASLYLPSWATISLCPAACLLLGGFLWIGRAHSQETANACQTPQEATHCPLPFSWFLLLLSKCSQPAMRPLYSRNIKHILKTI